MFIYVSIITFLLLFILCYKLAPSLKLIDKPNYRKIHLGNIPLIGGIIIYLNILLFVYYLGASYYFKVIYFTSAILVILGTFDDAIELGVTFRLISQLISCLLIIGSGLVIINIGDYMLLPNIKTGILSTIFTVFCVIGLTNAFNFIDGADGLCGGLFLVSILSLISFAYFSNTYELIEDIQIIYILIISIFLFQILNVTNFYKIFLGDSGSMFLGFLMSWFLILYTQINQIMHPVLALWCVTLPSYDIISVIIRRLLRKKNPFKPDRRHIHHILLSIGMSNKFVTIYILCLAIILNLIGFFTLKIAGPFPALLTYFLILFLYLIFSIQLSRYASNIKN